MMKRKIAPVGAIMAAALLSSSITGLADGTYILLLPASSEISYDVDDEHISEEFTSDNYTVLLYESGETVELKVDTDYDYTIQDAQTASVMSDYQLDDDGSITFAMPDADLCLILGELAQTGSEEAELTSEDNETVTEAETEVVSEDAGMQLILNGDCTAEITMVNGSTENLDENGIFTSDEKIDIFSVSSPSGFDTDPDVSVWKNGELIEDTSNIIINQGHTGSTYIVDLKNSMDLDGFYTVQFTMDGYAPREITVVSNGDAVDETVENSDVTEDDAESLAVEDEEDNGNMQIILFDNLSGEAVSDSGATTMLDNGSVTSIDERTNEITVTTDSGIPSSVAVEVYKDGAAIDADSVIDGMTATKDGCVITFSDDMAFDGSYRVIVTMDADAEILDPDTLDDLAETEEEMIEDEDSEENMDETENPEPASVESATETAEETGDGVSIIESEASGSVIEGRNYTFSVNIADGFAKTDDFAVKANGEVLQANEDGTYTIEHVTQDQDITVEGVADIEGPVISASIDGNSIESSDAQYFFKEAKSISIDAEDLGSGVTNIEYIVTDQPVSDLSTVTSWNAYEAPIELEPNAVASVYVKAEDGDGNVSYLSIENIAVYEDAILDNADSVFTKDSDSNAYATVLLNGNTIAEVSVDGSVLGEADCVIGDNGTVTLNNSFLSTLSSGDHQVDITVNPDGFAYVDLGMNDAPNDITYTLTVAGAETWVSNISSLSKEYDGQPVDAPSYDTNSNAEAVIEYKSTDEPDDAYTGEAPSDAGEYMIRISMPENDDFTGIEQTDTFTINPKQIEIVPIDQSIEYGEALDDSINAVNVDALADGDSLTAVVVSEDNDVITASDATIDNANGIDVTGNYNISYQSGILSVTPITQDAPVGLEGEAESIAGMGDGRIVGLTTDMEYSIDGSSYTAVTDPDMNFASGIYDIRYAEGDHKYASDPVSVTVEEGRMLSIVFMVDNELADIKEVRYGDSLSESELPAIIVNGEFTPSDAHWDVDDFSNITSDIVTHAVYTIEEYSVTFSSDDTRVTMTGDEDDNTDAVVDADVDTDFNMSIELQGEADVDVVLSNGETVSVTESEPYATTDKITSVTVQVPDDTDAEPEILLTRDGFEIDPTNNIITINKQEDGLYLITFSDNVELNDEYALTISVD